MQAASQDNSLVSQKTVSDDDQDNILSDLDFIRFILVAQKNLHWIVSILAIGALLSFIYLRYTKRVFQSKSLVKYDIKQVSPVFTQDQVQADNLSHISGEIELIKSNLIYEKAIAALPLDVSYFAYGRINNTERYRNSPFLLKYYELKDPNLHGVKFDLRIIDQETFSFEYHSGQQKKVEIHHFGDIIENPSFKFIIGKNGSSLAEEEIESSFYFLINSKESLLSYISSKLEVKMANIDAKTIEISFSDYDRLKARDIVEVIDSVYMIQTILKKNQAQEQSIAFLNEQLRITEQNLDQYESKIEAFTKQNKTADIKSQISKYLDKAEIEALLMERLKQQYSILNQLEMAISKDESIEKIIPMLSLFQAENNQLQEEANKLFDMQIKLQHLSATSKEKTFAIRSIKSDIASTRDILLDLTAEHRKLVKEEIVKSTQKLSDYNSAFSILPAKETEFTKLKRFYDLYEKFYLMLIDKKAEYGISKAGTVPEFQILSYPVPGSKPIYPNTFQVYFTGMAASLIVSFFLIVIQYFLHNTINNVGELERLILAPIMGVVPNFKQASSDYSRLVVDEYPKSPVSEALRSIRTNMEFISKGKSNRVISITSTISGEGKTFVAVNLGGIIAMSGQKVVILDLDLRKPKISKAFSSENSKGISTLLVGRSELEDTVMQTSIPTYYFVSSGPIPPNPSELIMSHEFDLLLEKLKKEFDVVIMDTPPVGIVTDGILAMQKSDLNIYIVRAEYSKKGFERSINNLITKSKFTNLAVVLNNFDNLRSYAYGYKYGYGQSYGYGGYYQTEDDNSEKSWFARLKSRFT